MEEAICAQSTLLASLEVVQQERLAELSRTSNSEHIAYIPHDGVILSLGVDVFRLGTDYGYEFMEHPLQLLAVISVAMFNKNPQVSDAPIDAPLDPIEYEQALCVKFRSLLAATVSTNAGALVMPDVGCGVYGNNPSVVGAAFGKVLRQEFWGYIQEVVLVGSERFKQAVEAAIGAVQSGDDNIVEQRHKAPQVEGSRNGFHTASMQPSSSVSFRITPFATRRAS